MNKKKPPLPVENGGQVTTGRQTETQTGASISAGIAPGGQRTARGPKLEDQMRVLVCGGRDYADASVLWGALDTLHRQCDTMLVIQGGARGADQMAREWCASRGIECKSYPANWAQDARSAGPKRNQHMIDDGKPHVVIACPGGRGTGDMVRRAKQAGIRVIEVAL